MKWWKKQAEVKGSLMSDTGKTPISFVGAGPGDPELITLKGRRLLDKADVIVFAGSLVNPALLQNLEAEIYDSAGMNIDEIIDILSSSFHNGKRCVRLHTGDPSLFGAVREQMKRLDELGIPFELVPGVSSAAAAAAAMKRELTCPGISQTVILTRHAGRTPVPRGQEIEVLARHQATMCIFLSVSMMDELVRELLAGGYKASTPVAVVEKASWPDERVVRGSIEDIASRVRRAGIKKTAMIIVGDVLELRGGKNSMLYHPGFSHGYRKGKE